MPKCVRCAPEGSQTFTKGRSRLLNTADAFARSAGPFELDGYFLKAIALLKQVLVIDPARKDINLRLAELHQMLQLMPEAMADAGTAHRTFQRMNDDATTLAASQKITELDPVQAEFREAELI